MQATIHNEFLTLTVDTLGAEAVSLKNAAGEELLWQADPAVWKRHAPILFPWTGKLPGGTFTHDGKTYKGRTALGWQRSSLWKKAPAMPGSAGL